MLREKNILPPKAESVARDLIQAIENTQLLPRNLRLRNWIPYNERLTDEINILLDSGQINLYEEKDVRFFIERKTCQPIEIIAYEGLLHNEIDFSNLEILEAYAHNLQEGLKKV